jgi:hypothetical protein
MERAAFAALEAWKTSPTRKPLVVRGARQVGKTWLLQEFGARSFENVAYVCMEDNAAMERLFEGSLEPARLLRGIAAATGQDIKPQTTLLILDEVQAVPRALTALKYFCEDAPEYAICVAGSLLGVALNAGISFPVGKVTFLHIYPLTFVEFLQAAGENSLVEALAAGDFDTLEIFTERLQDLLRTYYLVGGMPEAVSTFFGLPSAQASAARKPSEAGTTPTVPQPVTAEAPAGGVNFAAARQVQEDILAAYQGDFAKHASAITAERCRLIFTSLPRHLARENQKFSYGVVKKGARGRDLEDALQFLLDAGLVLKVPAVRRPGLPLAAYQDEAAFKLFCVDVGLLGALAQVSPATVLEGSNQFTHFKGALAKQYVAQQLVSACGLTPYYWRAPKSGAEVDFVVDVAGQVAPIEVKAEENLRAKSLAAFCKKYEITNAVRFSMANYRRDNWLTNVPLYAVSTLPQVIAQD